MNAIKLGSILEMTKGKKPLFQTKEYEEGLLPYVDIKAFETGIVDNYTNGQKCLPCENGDILLVCDGSRSGLVGYAIKGYVGSTLAKISAEGVIKQYLYYYLQSKYKILNTKQKGTGTPHVNPEVLKNFEIKVPPIAEQERIVARIEELFSQLDKAVETLQVVKEQLVVYRQAVLKDAFEGKLTEFWRVQNLDKHDVLRDYEEIKLKNITFKDVSGDENEIPLILPQYWKKVRLGEIFNVEVGGTPKRAIIDYWNGNVPWVSSGEVHFNRINYTEEAITQKGLLESSTKLQPKGTVLLAMIGEGKTRGQAAILDIEAAHNQNIAAIQVSKTPCSSKYIYYFFELNYENVRRTGSGNNQKALNKERVKAIRIPFTSFDEQKEIVRMIDMKLSINESIDRYIDDALEKANAMRQSILKQAFEGEFV